MTFGIGWVARVAPWQLVITSSRRVALVGIGGVEVETGA